MMWYNLKFRNNVGQQINFTDWQKETVDTLNENKNIKKVWLVNNQRRTGSTYFAKLLMFFRPPCTNTFIIRNNITMSKNFAYNNHLYGIEFYIEDLRFTKYSEWYKASNFFTPVTLFSLKKEIDEYKIYNKTTSFECLYDNDFNVKTYNTLCSYDFDFFIINVSAKYLYKARPFIEEDKDREDTLIVNIETALFPQIYKNDKNII